MANISAAKTNNSFFIISSLVKPAAKVRLKTFSNKLFLYVHHMHIPGVILKVSQMV